MTLYDIDDRILACVDMETGEIIDPDALDELSMQRDEKIENIALWIKDLKSEAEALKAEKMAFADRQARAEKKAASLSDYLSGYLDGQKWKSDKVEIRFRKTEAVEVQHPELLPAEYQRHVDPQPDKTLIKQAIKSGVVFDDQAGVELVSRKSMSLV